ncbi:MAG: hypothetical protein KF764_34595 [Labilithrix sp.]|nr:hypothetical protein [Labilithrix sp.]MBX3225366.1 hypothetical protein [Labilithrix sp.]
MVLAVAVVLGALLALFLYTRSRRAAPELARESTPELDRFVRDALEAELAESVLGVRGATPEERRKLAGTLADEPDVDVVGRIEELVRAVELEFVRYDHDADVETTVRVRYEDGEVGTSTRRLALADVPEAVRADFAAKGSTRVFRTWAFPWQRVRAL